MKLWESSGGCIILCGWKIERLGDFSGKETQHEVIGVYVITRVNNGDHPAGCMAQVAMQETAKLPMFMLDRKLGLN